MSVAPRPALPIRAAGKAGARGWLARAGAGETECRCSARRLR
jgi:hypothetical protein